MKREGVRTCSVTGKTLGATRPRHWPVVPLPITGLAALLWFLIRVIPKPSRATYPCQRVAMPLASGFMVWVAALVGSTVV